MTPDFVVPRPCGEGALGDPQNRLRQEERELWAESLRVSEIRVGTCAQMVLAICGEVSMMTWDGDGDLIASCPHLDYAYSLAFGRAHGCDDEFIESSVLVEQADMRSVARLPFIRTYPRIGRIVCELDLAK